MQELERRLRCRGTEDEETIQRRLKRAEAEIANSVNYDEHVVNIEVDSCAESIIPSSSSSCSTAATNESAAGPGCRQRREHPL